MSTRPLVLVADDEPRITKLVSLALGEEGFRVITAGGGEEALRKAEEYRPDVVLLDIVMPDLDGIEVMRQLRTSRPGRSSCSPRRGPRRTRPRVSTWAPTTMWRSRSIQTSSRPGCVPSSGGRRG